MINAICPNYGHALIGDDTYDFSVDIAVLREHVVGHCEDCNKEYQWVNIFTFSRVEEIEEVS